jgi:hypothetical protein
VLSKSCPVFACSANSLSSFPWESETTPTCGWYRYSQVVWLFPCSPNIYHLCRKGWETHRRSQSIPMMIPYCSGISNTFCPPRGLDPLLITPEIPLGHQLPFHLRRSSCPFLYLTTSEVTRPFLWALNWITADFYGSDLNFL